MHIYYGRFHSKSLEQIQSGDTVTEQSTIYQYPEGGFDLIDAQQRNRLYNDIFSIFKYSLSGSAKLSLHSDKSEPSKIENVPLQSNSPPLPPRRTSPRRSGSPKRPPSPKRKHNPDEEVSNESTRPSKKPATEEAKATNEEVKPAKVLLLMYNI